MILKPLIPDMATIFVDNDSLLYTVFLKQKKPINILAVVLV